MQRENKERKPIRRKVKGVRLLIPTVTIATIPFPFAFCGGQHPAGGPGPFCFWILSAVSFQRALLALFDCGKSYANCWAGKGCKILLSIQRRRATTNMRSAFLRLPTADCRLVGRITALISKRSFDLKGRTNTTQKPERAMNLLSSIKCYGHEGKGGTPVTGTRTKTVICTCLSYVPNQLGDGCCRRLSKGGDCSKRGICVWRGGPERTGFQKQESPVVPWT